MAKYNKIGDFLVSERLIDAAALDRGLELHTRTGASLGKALADLGLADEGAVAAAIAKMLNIELLTELPAASSEVRALLPVAFCRKHLVAPLSLNGKTLRLAMADPVDHATIQDVMFKCSKQVVPVMATQTAIVALLNDPSCDAAESQQAYEKLAGVNPEGQVEAVDEADLVNEAELEKKTNLTPVVRLVNLILSGAAKDGASDVHIEPKETFMQVRQRVDGLLEEVFKVPKHLQDATISRLKIISGMDITDRRRSQDGRSTLKFEDKRIDLRVSTLPTQFGEKVVIRLLKPQQAQTTMEKLDLTPESLQALQAMLVRRQGIILVTGPTGSGKSSTVYSALNWVKSPTKNIITVEDPIESLLVKYFLQNRAAWEIDPEIRRMVDFLDVNLIQPWPALPRMDIVLMRNVLIYLDAETKKTILSRVARLLAPDGYLILGGAETATNLNESFESVSLGGGICFRLKDGAAPRQTAA